jgi:hypothetical protein
MARRRKAVPLNQTTLLNLLRLNPNSRRVDLTKLRLLQTPSHSSCPKHHNLARSLDILDLKDSLSMVCRVSQASNPASRASQ